MVNVDVIMCGGKENMHQINFKQIKYGTRDTEKGFIENDNYHLIEMVDLNWKDYNHKKYINFIDEVYKAKENKIDYVVIKDLEEIGQLDFCIDFSKKFSNKVNQFILPIKINIDFDILPDNILPGFPSITNYSLKKDMKQSFDAFQEYNGDRKIHHLGGRDYQKMLTILKTINHYLRLNSFDGNGVLFQARHRSFYNGYRWVHRPDLSIIENLQLSINWMNKQKEIMDRADTCYVYDIYNQFNKKRGLIRF